MFAFIVAVKRTALAVSLLKDHETPMASPFRTTSVVIIEQLALGTSPPGTLVFSYYEVIPYTSH
jgi:hypothetical protein